jgi:hypothetical protein
MELKAKYKLSYVLDKEEKNLILEVELVQPDGLPKPFQNAWQGFATLNGEPYEEEDLSHCVNAKLAAIRIGTKLRDKLKNEAKEKGQRFRIKEVDIK